jgi:hypothetical protein
VLGSQNIRDPSGEVRYLFGKLLDRFFPVHLVGLAVIEEKLERLDEGFRLGEVAVQGDAVVLIQHGTGRRLEEDICERLAARHLRCDLALQVIGRVLRLPQTMDQSQRVHERPIGAQGLLLCAFERILFHEVPVIGAGTARQQVGEGRAGIPLGCAPAVETERVRRNTS